MDSHDDACLTVEIGGPAGEELAPAVVARILQEVAAGVVRAASRHARAAEVSAPPGDAVAHLLTVAPEFELRPVAAPGKPGRVRVAFAALEPGTGRWFGRHDFVPRGHLDYDSPTAGWQLRYH